MTARTAYEPLHKKARRSALLDYARAHDRFAEQEQIDAHLLGMGLVDEETYLEDAGIARMFLRAYRAELDNPKPDGLR